MTLNLAQPSTIAINAARDKATLKKVFQTITWNSCPLSYNFHMHSTFSDGQLRPEQIVNQAIRIGLKGLAITDHHSVGGYQAAQKLLNCWQQEHQSQRSYGQTVPHLWTGVEINSGLVGTEVHILGYAFDPQHPRMQPYLQGVFPTGRDYEAKQVIAAIQKAGGLAVLAHPVRYRLKPSELIHAAADLGIDGVETYYAYRNPNPWQPSPQQTEQVKELAEEYNLLSTCGTDTHGSNLLLRL